MITFEHTKKMLLIVVVILSLQVFRNISTVIYVGILFLAYALLYSFFIYESKKGGGIEIRRITGAKIIFLVTYLILPLQTLDNLEYFSIAFPRYLVTLPFIFFLFIFPYVDVSLLKRIMRIFIFVSVLSSLSIFIQIVTGPISFFADSSFREGLDRYSTLSGSLTAFGTTGSIAVCLLLFDKKDYYPFVRKIFLVILILGLLCSLQKSAVINLLVALLFYLLFATKRITTKVKIPRIFYTIILLITIMFFVSTLYDKILGSKFLEYMFATVDYTLSNQSSVGVKADLLSRLTLRPFNVLNFHDISFNNIFLGIGLKALGGIMGLSFLPMAHNNYFDLLFSGGIFHLISFLWMCVSSFFSYINSLYYKEFSGVVFIYLINMMIGAGSFYQPLLCLIIFPILLVNKENLRKSDIQNV